MKQIIWCRTCNKAFMFDIPEAGLIRYASGALIQDAFPTMPIWQREMIMTGICPSCWKKLMSYMDETDES